MTAAYTSAELVTILGVFFAGMLSIVTAVFAGIAAMRAGRTITVAGQIHDEVKTMNGLRLGELADNSETRRVVDIPPGDRTTAEREHIIAVPLHDRPTAREPLEEPV